MTDVQLLSVGELAKRLMVSKRTIWSMLSSGRLPRPIRLGRSVRFRASDIEQWIELGCPPRERWEAMRQGAAR